MSQSYKKSCMYCNETIEMNDKTSGKWLPYNMDGSQHDCRNQKQQSIAGTKKIEIKINKPSNPDKDKDKEITPEAKAWVREILEGPKLKEIEARLKRVESIVIGPQK